LRADAWKALSCDMKTDAPTLHSSLARLGQVVFPRRLWVGLAVVVLAAFMVEPRPILGRWHVAAEIVSLALVILGLALRTWAGGCAGRHTREARIEAPRLVTGGPYALVRNPIYFASIVLGFGMVGLVGDPWLLAMHVGVCILLYVGIVPAEEEFLRERFGPEYSRYCANVPRFWPRLSPWPEAEPVRWDASSLVGELRLGLVLVAIYGGLHGAAWLRG
jgi:protein-S-isoprenylcysteine O-methyltransferase Ste14